MRRWLKLLGATIALGAAVLLAVTSSTALAAGLWWLASLTTVGMWPCLAAVAGLLWSAAREEPHQGADHHAGHAQPGGAGRVGRPAAQAR